MREIKLQAEDGAGEFSAFIYEPANATQAGAVVVIQEIFGVNDALRATCQELAAMGFIAVAPDLFWRQEPGVNLTDKSEEEWKKAFALMNGFDQKKGVQDLQTTLDAARALPGCNGRAGTIGFCLGGRLAVMMALDSDSDVNISYYGVGLNEFAEQLDSVTAPLVIHIAEKDEFSSPEVVDAVMEGAEENPYIETYVYPDVQHAFARVNGVHYDARAATIANGRTAEILAEVLD